MTWRLLVAWAAVLTTVSAAESSRPRLAVLTDIGGDPDDQQSMVRLMHYANEFELELLIATSVRGKHAPKGPECRPQLIHEIVSAYGEVLPNLRRHAQGWPEASELLSRVVAGNPRHGRDHIGEGFDTDASRALVARIDAGTPERPLNISIWGGQSDLAQALSQVKRARGAAGLEAFVRRFRVYDVADQDGIADWMHAEFPGMYYILAKPIPGRPKEEATYRGMYVTGDETLTSVAWITENVKNRSVLGALYPTKAYTAPNPHACMKEGDSPSWLFFLSLGGNDPRDPSKPGWGGQYQPRGDGRYGDIPAREGFDPRETVSRWRPDFQRDFARRIGWGRPDTASAQP